MNRTFASLIAAASLLSLTSFGCQTVTSPRSGSSYQEVRDYHDGVLQTVTRIEDGAHITVGPIDCQCYKSDQLDVTAGVPGQDLMRGHDSRLERREPS